MKYKKYVVIFAVVAGVFLISCGSNEHVKVSSVQEAETEETSQADPAVMIGGVLYYNTGEEDEEGGQCGTMDGYITSSVSDGQLPAENDQSNFGDGYGYQLGREAGTYEIYIDGRWMIFSKDE